VSDVTVIVSLITASTVFPIVSSSSAVSVMVTAPGVKFAAAVNPITADVFAEVAEFEVLPVIVKVPVEFLITVALKSVRASVTVKVATPEASVVAVRTSDEIPVAVRLCVMRIVAPLITVPKPSFAVTARVTVDPVAARAPEVMFVEREPIDEVSCCATYET